MICLFHISSHVNAMFTKDSSGNNVYCRGRCSQCKEMHDKKRSILICLVLMNLMQNIRVRGRFSLKKRINYVFLKKKRRIIKIFIDFDKIL